MKSLPPYKETVKPLENLVFVTTCVTGLNDFKVKQFHNGLKENFNNISILLDKNDSEMEEFAMLGAQHFNGNWWAKIAGGQLDFIEDNETNKRKVVKMYEKIGSFKVKDIMKFCLSEWISINNKNKIFSFKLSTPKDFFKNKKSDNIATCLWWVHYYTTLLGCHEEPKGLRRILCLKKSLLGKWTREKWY